MMRAKAILIAPFSEAVFSELPLGIAYLAAVLKNEGCLVKIINPRTRYQRLSIQKILNDIREFSPDFIGLSFYTENILLLYQYINKLEILKIPLIAGGPHSSVLPREVLNNGIDIVVRGEGEETVSELLSYFCGDVTKEDILGISYKDKNGNIIDNPDRPPVSNLDSIPFPARYLFENSANIRNKVDYSLFSSIIASRGCPFKCIYCQHKNYPHYRYRSTSNIIEEIKFLKDRYNLGGFAFEDSVFTINKECVLDICEALIKENLKIGWSCSSRLDIVDTELLTKMKQAGCWHIVYGAESLNPDTLKKIRKGINPVRLDVVAGWMQDLGISMGVNFMWGFPWESAEDIKENLRKVTSKSRYFNKIMAAGIPMPFPGTELYELYKDEYNFENWWLNPHKRYNYNPYFYQSFAFGFQDGLIENPFFNYSKEMKKSLREVANFITNFNNRHLSSKKKVILKALMTLSKVLSRILPWAEINIFQKILFRLIYIRQRVILVIKIVKRLVLKVLLYFRLYPNIFHYLRPFKIYEFRELKKGVRILRDDAILDIGCADGFKTMLIGKKCRKIIGIDISEEAIKGAKRVAELQMPHNSEFRCMRLENAGFENESFDKIFSICVLEHIPNYVEVLMEAYRILKKNGQMIFSVDSLEIIDDKQLVKKHKKQYSVEKYFREEELRTTLEEIGFKNIHIYSICKSNFAKKRYSIGINNDFQYGESYIHSILVYMRLRFEEFYCAKRNKGIYLVAKCLK